MRKLRPRLRYLLLTRGRQLAVALVVVGIVLAGWGAWVYAHPPTTHVVEETDERTVQSSLGTRAVVTGDSSLYDRGRVLRNRSVYLLPDAPNLTVRLTSGLAEAGEIDLTQRIALRYRATHDGETFWSETRQLVSRQVTTEDAATVAATVDLPAVRETLAEKRASVGSAGSVSAELVFRVSYETGEYAGEFTLTRTLQPARGWYTVAPTTEQRTHSQTHTRVERLPRSPTGYLVPAGAGVAAIAGGVGLFGLLHRRDDVDPDRLEQRMHAAQYAEWVSPGRLSDTDAERHVEMQSLPALVDVAIDADRRVVRDETTGRYAVLDDRTIYYYDPEYDATDCPADPFEY